MAFLSLLAYGREVIYNDSSTGFSLFGEPAAKGQPLIITDLLEGCIEGGDRDVTWAIRLRDTNKGSKGAYRLYITNEEGDTLSLSVESIHVHEFMTDKEDTHLVLKLGDEVVGETVLPRKKFDNAEGFNTIRIERIGRDIAVYGGKSDPQSLFRLSGSDNPFNGPIVSIGLIPRKGSGLEIEKTQLTLEPSIKFRLETQLDEEDLKNLTEEKSGTPTGLWSMLDFDFDDRYLKNGGDYNLAIIPCDSIGKETRIGVDWPTGSYAIIYLSGASMNNREWELGMVKGFLIPTALTSAWRVIWYDSEGQPLNDLQGSSMATASLDESGKILQLSFPERYSSLRLFRNGRLNP